MDKAKDMNRGNRYDIKTWNFVPVKWISTLKFIGIGRKQELNDREKIQKKLERSTEWGKRYEVIFEKES